MRFNYYQICFNLLKDLPKRQKEVLSRRFGLKGGRREVLEFIGKDYGITRERVRQIERDGILKLESKIKEHQKVFQYFEQYLKNAGGLKREDIFLDQLGGQKEKNAVFFLLTLSKNFERFGESDKLYSLWTINQKSLINAKNVINSILKKFKQSGKPLALKSLKLSFPLNKNILNSYLEISKKIQKNSEDLFGLPDWPEINPRGIKDKAYLMFKKEEKPLHFTEVAKLLTSALPQTVHNELIKDPRFVLVGRGLYALKDWGYEQGYVKDVIFKVLRDSKKPLAKEEVLEKVLKQRLVKENTVLLNLSNKKHFLRTVEGHYIIREA